MPYNYQRYLDYWVVGVSGDPGCIAPSQKVFRSCNLLVIFYAARKEIATVFKALLFGSRGPIQSLQTSHKIDGHCWPMHLPLGLETSCRWQRRQITTRQLQEILATLFAIWSEDIINCAIIIHCLFRKHFFDMPHQSGSVSLYFSMFGFDFHRKRMVENIRISECDGSFPSSHVFRTSDPCLSDFLICDFHHLLVLWLSHQISK
jgi:hypothetical protein